VLRYGVTLQVCTHLNDFALLNRSKGFSRNFPISVSSVVSCKCSNCLLFHRCAFYNLFGPKRDGVTGEWRKRHNEELHDLYCSPNIVRVITSRGMRWVGYVTRLGEGRNVYRVLLGEPEGKISLGRPKPRWEDNIMMDL
jgi:hypothetical protein